MTKGTKGKQNFISGRLQTGTSLPLPTAQHTAHTQDHMQAPVCLENVWGALQRQHSGRAPLAWAGCHSQMMTPCLKLTRAPTHTHTHTQTAVSAVRWICRQDVLVRTAEDCIGYVHKKCGSGGEARSFVQKRQTMKGQKKTWRLSIELIATKKCFTQ